jgi:hypothetical protein
VKDYVESGTRENVGDAVSMVPAPRTATVLIESIDISPQSLLKKTF